MTTIDIQDVSVKVPGGSLFVRCWNNGRIDHSPIILLHDSLGCVDLWRDFPIALANATSRPIIEYDRLGFGKSTPRTAPPSFKFIPEEAEVYFPELLRALDINRFVLFGYSVGGGMSLVIASRFREECEAVITESAQSFVEPHTIAGLKAAKKQFSNPAHFARLGKWHGERARWVLDAWLETWLAPEFLNWNLDEHLAGITCPVLAIHGDRDEYGSEEFPRRIVKNVAGPAEMAIMNDCGHMPHREKEAEVLRLTASFLGRHLQKM
jgi:pimeloyl-ACP methyl ester carboxylesterase